MCLFIQLLISFITYNKSYSENYPTYLIPNLVKNLYFDRDSDRHFNDFIDGTPV